MQHSKMQHSKMQHIKCNNAQTIFNIATVCCLTSWVFLPARAPLSRSTFLWLYALLSTHVAFAIKPYRSVFDHSLRCRASFAPLRLKPLPFGRALSPMHATVIVAPQPLYHYPTLHFPFLFLFTTPVIFPTLWRL